MDSRYLSMAYECLSSIGNSFELESMMGEVVLSFLHSTKAIFVGYYQDVKQPVICSGDKSYHKEIVYPEDTYIKEHKDSVEVVLKLKHSYLLLFYQKSDEIYKIYEMLCGFTRKINFAISACDGVKKLEELNEELDSRVKDSIKKLREQEQMLLVQSKSATMGEMLEMIAHQWRQPLTSISMIANNILFTLIVDDELDSKYIQKELNDINAQIKYLSDTIDDFRGFFKGSKTKESFSVLEIINKSISLLRSQLEQSSIDIEVVNNLNNIFISSYKSEFVQILLNLLNNSKEAFEDKDIKDKKITITIEARDDMMVIKVLDNAGGINDEVLPNIFQPYFSTKKQKNGTGLGLYMVKVIVNRYLNGSIFVSSNNQTTEFSIVVPQE